MLNDDMEYRFVEFRAEKDLVTGVAVPYGKTARIDGFSEEFRAGAFGDIGDVVLNIQHQRTRPVARTGGSGLELTDGPDELRTSVRLPETSHGRDARELIEAGILRGFSIEFRATEDEWQGRHRIVKRATLYGIALVDRPAYSDAQIARRWEKRENQEAIRKDNPARYWY